MGVCFRVCLSRVKLPAEGGLGRGPTGPGALMARPGGGRATCPPSGPSIGSGDLLLQGFSGIFLRCLNFPFPTHKKDIHAALLKTTSVRVIFVQIMQE